MRVSAPSSMTPDFPQFRAHSPAGKREVKQRQVCWHTAQCLSNWRPRRFCEILFPGLSVEANYYCSAAQRETVHQACSKRTAGIKYMSHAQEFLLNVIQRCARERERGAAHRCAWVGCFAQLHSDGSLLDPWQDRVSVESNTYRRKQ
jgi:hypothetical protein